MFEEFAGLPAHPLLVHAAVVFVPLLAVVAIAYAILPFIRPHIRLVLAGLALIAPSAVYAAKLAGDTFRSRLIADERLGGKAAETVLQHRDFGNMTLYTTLALAVATLALVFFVAPRRGVTVAAHAAVGAGRAGEAGGFDAAGEPGEPGEPGAVDAPRPPAPGSGMLSLVLAGVTVVAAAISLYYVIRTGDSGARAVWGQP